MMEMPVQRMLVLLLQDVHIQILFATIMMPALVTHATRFRAVFILLLIAMTIMRARMTRAMLQHVV